MKLWGKKRDTCEAKNKREMESLQKEDENKISVRPYEINQNSSRKQNSYDFP